MWHGRMSPGPRPLASMLMVSVPQSTGSPTRSNTSSRAPDVRARRLFQRHRAAGDRGGHQERAGLDPVGHHGVLGAAQALLAVDLDGVGVGPRDLPAHLVEELDEIVDLGFLRRRPDHGVTVRERGREHRVLGAHHRDEREADLGARAAARARWRSSSRTCSRSGRPSPASPRRGG